MSIVTKKQLLLSFGLVAVAGLLGFAAGFSTRPRVTRAALEDITNGMTFDEVTAIMGVPPGDYASGWLVMENSVRQVPPRY